MSSHNTKERSEELQAIAQSLINFPEYETASLKVAKALTVVYQLRMMEQTGCTSTTARIHIHKAIRRLRYINSTKGKETMLSQAQKETAAEITRFVVENGRVESDSEGNLNTESLRVEVEFECDERGIQDSAEIAEYAASNLVA